MIKKTTLLFIIFILILIGWIRLVLEVELIYKKNNQKWFSYDKDIFLIMSFYPYYLCFFLCMAAYIILKLLKVNINKEHLLVFFFLIQFVHILVPVIDYLNLRSPFAPHLPDKLYPLLNSFWTHGEFSLNPFSDLRNISMLPIYFTPFLLWFTNPITLGINVAWIIAGSLFFLLLRKKFKVGILKTILTILILFQISYWPIYRYFFLYDKLFNKIIGIDYYNHYGYGFYFLIAGTIGLIYFYKDKTEDKNKLVT